MGLKEERVKNEKLEAQLRKQEQERQEDRATIQRLNQQISTLSVQLGQFLVQQGFTEESHTRPTGLVKQRVQTLNSTVAASARNKIRLEKIWGHTRLRRGGGAHAAGAF